MLQRCLTLALRASQLLLSGTAESDRAAATARTAGQEAPLAADGGLALFHGQNKAPLLPSVSLSFSSPRIVSPPVQCYDASQKQPCGYRQNSTCRCPELPAAADSFYGLSANATHMLGVYSEREQGITEITYTSDSGSSWKRKEFSGPLAAFAWNLFPVEGGAGRRTFGGISRGSYRNESLGSVTSRSWTGRQSATYSFDASGELQMQATGPVTVGPLPHPVNNTNGVADTPIAPQFYGGPIALHDGSLLGTVGVYWSRDNPLKPTADGPEHRMSIVAIRSTNSGDSWQFAGVVANASGPGGYSNSSFGPSENDIAVLADGKTLMCVLRMDGDGRCATGSYRYYSVTYSRDDGATWSRAVAMPGAGCVWPRLLRLEAGPLILSGARLCVEHTDDVSIWVNADGMAGAANGGPGVWTRYSVSYRHNAMWIGPTGGGGGTHGASYSYLFDAQINNSNAFATPGFTSLVRAGPSAFVLIYQKYFSPSSWPPFPLSTFQMKVSVSM
jgi:hypothetical protein